MATISYPTHYSTRTNNSLAKDLTIFIGLVVEGVLDVRILESKAQELVALWPILGGTLVTNANPYSFKSGSSCDFRSRKLDISVREYLPINLTAQGSNAPTYQENLEEGLFHFNSIKLLNRLPKELLTIRVTILKDATLLGFRVPHHFCDGQSMYDVIRAYSMLVAGRRIPDLMPPPDTDVPLSTLLEHDSTSFLSFEVRKEKISFLHAEDKLCLGFPAWIKYVGYAAAKMIAAKLGIKSLRSEEKYIHLPGSLVDHWQTECQEQLDESPANKDIKLSKMDVISAWLLKASFHTTKPTSEALNMMYQFSYRPFLQPPTDPNSIYLKNSYYELRINWPSLETFQSLSLSEIARTIRLAVLHGKQPEIIKSNLEFQEKHATELVAPCPPGTDLSLLPFISSWTGFEYNGMDFSGALGKGERTGGMEGRVVFTQPRVALPMGVTVDPLAIVLKDGRGGYWVRANLSEGWRGHEALTAED